MSEDFNRSDLKRDYHTDSDSEDYVNYDGRRIEATEEPPQSPLKLDSTPGDDSEEGAIDSKPLPQVPKVSSQSDRPPSSSSRKRVAMTDQRTDRPTSMDASYSRVDHSRGYQMTIRALFTRKESGVVIGKQGSNVAEIRAKSGARVHLGDGNNGATERVAQVVGTLGEVSKVATLLFCLLIVTRPTD